MLIVRLACSIEGGDDRIESVEAVADKRVKTRHTAPGFGYQFQCNWIRVGVTKSANDVDFSEHSGRER